MIHKPVLLNEVLKYLDPKPGENFIDCTVGEGGHAGAILGKTGSSGTLLGIDLDFHQIEKCKLNLAGFGDRAVLANDSYANLKEIAEIKKFGPVSGILLDLGMSSAQLEGTEKGFSFKLDQGLDMRYNDQTGWLTADKIVNEWPQEKIEQILREYGEEKFSKKIAKNITEQRKRGRIKTTFELVEIIKSATPSTYRRKKIHFATKTFQALRIAVNGELENLQRVLPQILGVMEKGGRFAVISFHSLEDRIVKSFLKNKEKEKILKLLTKKPVCALPAETAENPRSRSAKLRVAEKI